MFYEYSRYTARDEKGKKTIAKKRALVLITSRSGLRMNSPTRRVICLVAG